VQLEVCRPVHRSLDGIPGLVIEGANLMMRLTGDFQLTCGDCGAVFMVRQEYTVNLQPMKFCPQCGTANLREHKAPLQEMLKAACFSGVDGRLVQMLYSVWATDAEFKRIYPRFVDYLNNELKFG
jgi:hypothetical protein